VINREIKQKLPHRWPFLYVDRVTKIDKQLIEGYKNVSSSDIVFLGHFPEISILPGVIIVEALAQLSGLLLSSRHEGVESDAESGAAETKIGFLTSIRSFKFLKVVEPGDQLFLKSILKSGSGDCYIFAVAAYVERAEVAIGEIQLYLQNKESIL
jgi:3-hydroxyacyl-[acyl-carrier-protein] dehydratase